MKNINLVFNIVLAVAVGILYFLHFKGSGNVSANSGSETTESKKEITVDTSSLPNASIVYVNSDSLFAKYEMVADIRTELEKDRKQKEAQFEKEYRSLEQKVNNFKEIAERLSQEEGQKQQMDLMQQEQSLGARKEQLMTELTQKEQDKNILIQDKIANYIKRLNEKKQYTYVLGYSPGGGGILYAKNSLEITDIVIKGLNEEYKEGKKK